MRGNVLNLSIFTFNQQSSGLIVKCLEIPHYAYSSRCKQSMKTRILILILFGLISCQDSQLEADQALQEKVENEIRNKSKVNFAEHTDFEWDQMIAIGPYSQVDQIADSLDLDLGNIKNNGIRHSDYYTLVVFLNNKKSVRIIEPTKRFDRSGLIIPKNQSTFKINRDGVLSRTD